MALPEFTCRVSEYLMNYPIDICTSNIMKISFSKFLRTYSLRYKIHGIRNIYFNLFIETI